MSVLLCQSSEPRAALQTHGQHSAVAESHGVSGPPQGKRLDQSSAITDACSYFKGGFCSFSFQKGSPEEGRVLPDSIVHTSIHFLYPLNPSVGSRGGWSLAQGSSGERRGTPWTGRQSITGPYRDERDKQPHTCSHSLLKTILETPINLTCMFLTVGGSLSTRREDNIVT